MGLDTIYGSLKKLDRITHKLNKVQGSLCEVRE